MLKVLSSMYKSHIFSLSIFFGGTTNGRLDKNKFMVLPVYTFSRYRSVVKMGFFGG